jgi:hypothetical protein
LKDLGPAIGMNSDRFHRIYPHTTGARVAKEKTETRFSLTFVTFVTFVCCNPQFGRQELPPSSPLQFDLNQP